MCQAKLCDKAQEEIRKIVDLLMPEADIKSPFHYAVEQKRDALRHSFSTLAMLAK